MKKLLFITLFLISCGGSKSNTDHHTDSHSRAEEYEKGVHSGRVFRSDKFSIELSIYEEGSEPKFHLYAYENGKLVDPKKCSAKVMLNRLGNEEEIISFTALDNFLISNEVIKEPHSFKENIQLECHNDKYEWTVDSFESRTEISDDLIKASNIEVEKVTARKIGSSIKIRGKVVPSEHKIAHIIPRYAGVVREGRKHIGDKVEKGEVLAIIESNQSLQPFEVKSQISGTVINGHLIVGEYVAESQWVYIVSDLSEVWADFFVPVRESQSIKIGQDILIKPLESENIVKAKVSYIAPYADEKTQSQLIRVIVSNEGNLFLPGMFVTGEVIVDEKMIDNAVRKIAVQDFNGKKSVFIKVGNIFEVRPVTLGRSDNEYVEVLEGVRAGQDYVTTNSYVVKADILKEGAVHE